MVKEVEVTAADAENALDSVSPIIMGLVAVGAHKGAYVRIGNRTSGERLAERGFGVVKPQENLDYKDLSGQKYSVVFKRGVSMRYALNNPAMLDPNERKLHRGAFLFGDCIIAVAGLGDSSETIAFVLAQYLGLLYVPAVETLAAE